MSISDRVVVMEGGCATQIDNPHSVYEHPRTRSISTFVGKANLLTGHVVAGGAKTRVNLGSIEVDVDDLGFRHGTLVLLSVRPEKLQLREAGQGRLDGTVRERFFLGSQWLYTVNTALGELSVLSPNDGRPALDEGHVAGIDWPTHCTRLLPADEAALHSVEPA
jgi:putative spermidine/putrescine transport system ATP-binding protein